MHLYRITTLFLAAAALAGCANSPASPPAPATVFAPNANLFTQGIPPIPQTLVDRVANYADFRGHSFVDWHPQQRQMVVAHRKADDTLTQLYLIKSPLATPEQLTNATEPVTSATFEPRTGSYLVFERSSGGNEAAQLFRLDLASRQTTLLTNPDERHNALTWLHGRSELLYTSQPLDRTAQGGRRADVTTTFWLMDPLQPQSRRKVAELPGGGWWGTGVSRDDRQLALTRYLSANESQVWLLNLASGERRQVLPTAGETVKVAHFSVDFSLDGKTLFFTSNRAGEFSEAMRLDLTSGAIARISAHIPWDVAGGSATEDGRWMALQFNVDGRDELRLFDGNTLKELAPPKIPNGSVGSTNFHRAHPELAFSLNSAHGPSQLWTLDVTNGRVEQWTQAYAPAGVDMTRFVGQEIVRWKSFDGRTISGLLSEPPAQFKGKRPVLIDIHGGPEGQSKIGFMNRYNYFLNELGIAIVQPNVRGSRGFGKTFLTLDDGILREDSVKDIGALLDWIATQPNLDASRVMVSGGSYGGYMSLAVSTHYADRIAGAIDTVGISNFVTFLNSTESYRRDLRRAEYGDERDPAMRAFLEKISPLTNAHKITKPLLVIQGKNDPRVPVTEAEQIVERARANGTPVWYLRADNEGHGFVRKENADFRFYTMVRFIESVLLR